MRRICRRLAAVSKKSSGLYTATHAALGGRTLKTGQSRWFVGYKKHTLRLWLPTSQPSVTLVPGQLGDASQCVRKGPTGAKFALVSPEFGLVAGHGGGGYGIPVSRRQAAGAGRLADGGGDQTALGHEAAAALSECG